MKQSHALIIVTIVLGAIGTILVIAGALFKIMHWPGASVGLLAGAAFEIAAIILLAVWAIRKVSR